MPPREEARCHHARIMLGRYGEKEMSWHVMVDIGQTDRQGEEKLDIRN